VSPVSWQQNLLLGVGSGLLPIMVVGLARAGWNRRRVPTALARSMRRRHYLSAVLAESERPGLSNLDVLAPRLTPAAGGPGPIGAIQAAWKRIDLAGRVRVVTLDSDDCLQAGAELLVGEIEVRVTPRDRLGKEDLSYHVLRNSTGSDRTVLVNRHEGGKDRPVRLTGAMDTEIYQEHFERIWASAIPLESFLVRRIIDGAGEGAPVAAVVSKLNEDVDRLHLDQRCIEMILPHLAFRHGSPVIFVMGLPGSGKSFVRRQLAALLAEKSIKTAQLTDYDFAYRDFVHHLIKLDPPRGEGYEAYGDGAFSIKDEANMAPALQALAGAVRDSVAENEATLVEFARSNLVTALQEFDGIRTDPWLIYVSAPEALRADRLSRRATPPRVHIDGNSVVIDLSDDHLLPSTVERTLYGLDDIDRLGSLPRWRDRIWKIENNVDDHGGRIEQRLAAFIETHVDGYRPAAASRRRATSPRPPQPRNRP
jgi:hypothetical protein